MARPVTNTPAPSTLRCRLHRKRRAMIESFTTLAYGTSDNASLQSLQELLDSINKDTPKETLEANQ